jgi:hypothetical protein
MAFLILAGVAFAIAMAGCLVANLSVSAIVDELNRGRPTGEQISAFGWYPGKVGSVLRAHRAAYPASPRPSRMWWGLVAMASGLLACFAFLTAAGPSLAGPYGRAAAHPPPNESLQPKPRTPP